MLLDSLHQLYADSAGNEGINNQPVTARLIDQNGNTLRSNDGNLIEVTHNLVVDDYVDFEVTTSPSGLSPLALDGTTGWSNSDISSNLLAPSSPNTSNVNGITKIQLQIDFPNVSSTTEFSKIKIYSPHYKTSYIFSPVKLIGSEWKLTSTY